MIAIIIPVFNELKLTQSIVEQIRKFTHSPHMLIIVNNGSTDGTHEWLQGEGINYLDPVNSRVINKIKNEGVAKAWNDGMKHALWHDPKIEHFVFINNDIDLYDGWLEDMISKFKGGIHFVSCEGVHPLFSGWYFAMDKYCYECVGLFDEQFSPFWFEDTDYAIRLWKKHIGIGRYDFPIVHHTSSTLKTIPSEEFQRVVEANRIRFETKWGLETISKFFNYAKKKAMGLVR